MPTKDTTPPAAGPKPTPENTPVPGGGSWRWDIAGPGWVENTTTESTTESTKD